MNVNGRMAVLALHALLIMDVLFHSDIVFCMEAGLVLRIFIKWRGIWCFHKALEGNTNALTTVVACGAGFNSETMVRNIPNRNVCVTSSLNLMRERMAGFCL